VRIIAPECRSILDMDCWIGCIFPTAATTFFAPAPQGGAEWRFVAFARHLRVEPAGLGCLSRANA
jgi:hypothetical protein